MDFGGISFEQLQVFIGPVVKMLGGPDIAAEIEDKSDVLIASGEFLQQAAELMLVAGAAMADGLLTDEEIDEIITDAESVWAARLLIEQAWIEDDNSED